MILSRLLPGLREIRTPLVTGFIWLVPFGLFLVFGSGTFELGALSGISPKEVDKLPTDTATVTVIGATLSRIYAWISNPIIAAVLCLLAYLVGSVSTMISNGLVAGLDRLIGIVLKQPHEHLEFANIVRLVGREPELYDLYDRLRSEIEFRAGTSLPLAAIAWMATRWQAGNEETASVLVGLWWGFVVMVALMVQAVRRHRRLRVIMIEALRRFDAGDERRLSTEPAGDETPLPADEA